MAIDTSGKWWVGSEANDIREYLEAYEAEGYEVDETRTCRCGCGSIEFELEADHEAQGAQRICAGCGARHLICDSANYWGESEPEIWQCTECDSKTCNVGVGFSLYEPEDENDPDVRWISIGQRCTKCGTLGSIIDWKVAYGPTYQLLEKA